MIRANLWTKTVTFTAEDGALGILWEGPIGDDDDDEVGSPQLTEVTVKAVDTARRDAVSHSYSPAYLAGIAPGDRLVSINGVPVQQLGGGSNSSCSESFTSILNQIRSIPHRPIELTFGNVGATTIARHSKAVTDVAFCPRDSRGVVRYSSAPSAEMRGVRLRTREGGYDVASLSTNLGEVADAMVKLWRHGEADDSMELPTLTHVTTLAFSPDGDSLAFGFKQSNAVQCWRIGDPDTTPMTTHGDYVTSVAFSPNGLIVASGSNDDTVKLRWLNGPMTKTLSGHSNCVNSVAFRSCGRILASGSCDTTVKLWQVDDGATIATLTGHEDSVTSVAFSMCDTLASGSDDFTVRLWEYTDGEYTLAKQLQHSDYVTSVAFRPCGRILASGSCDRTIKLWRVQDGAAIATLFLHTSYVTSLAFSPCGRELASGIEKTVKLWHLDNLRLTDTWEARHLGGYVTSLRYHERLTDGPRETKRARQDDTCWLDYE